MNPRLRVLEEEHVLIIDDVMVIAKGDLRGAQQLREYEHTHQYKKSLKCGVSGVIQDVWREQELDQLFRRLFLIQERGESGNIKQLIREGYAVCTGQDRKKKPKCVDFTSKEFTKTFGGTPRNKKKKRKDERKIHKAGNHITESDDSVWYDAPCSTKPENVRYSTDARDVTCGNCKKMMKKRSTMRKGGK